MSSPTSSRFTAWLSEQERAGLHELAGELQSSDNYVLRSVLRLFLGLPVSPWARELAAQRLDELAAGEPRLRELA